MTGLKSLAEPEQGSPAWWDTRYLSGDIPWDTGIVPPEVARLISLPDVQRGWALDLGCGSGLSSRYLARHGFWVVGIDLSLSALDRAYRAARAEGAAAYFCAGDVSDLTFLAIRCTLALDVGCFHAVPPAARPAYVSSLGKLLLPGAHYLLYAFELSPLHDSVPPSRNPFRFAGSGTDGVRFPAAEPGPPGVGPRDIAGFAPYFTLRWAQHGIDSERLAAWYLLQRV